MEAAFITAVPESREIISRVSVLPLEVLLLWCLTTVLKVCSWQKPDPQSLSWEADYKNEFSNNLSSCAFFWLSL
jgi:hypothetical protein